MAGTWSSYARLQALTPSSFGAVSLDAGNQHGRTLGSSTLTVPDFTRTIPLSELMQADQAVQQAAAQAAGASPLRRAARTGTPLGRSLNPGASLSASMTLGTTSLLPLRVPRGDGYTASLETVHAERADRLLRQPRGWSQGAARARRERAREEKEESGRIAIYQPGVHEALCAQAAQASHPTSASRSTKRLSSNQRPAFVPSEYSGDESLASLGSVASSAITAALNPRLRSAERAALGQKKLREFWSEVAAEKEHLQAKLRERIARNAAKEEAAFQAMMDRTCTQDPLMQEITEYLALHDQDKERAKDALYRQWCTQVYGPIQEAISSGLAGRSTASIEARRLQSFDEYLRRTNRERQQHLDDPMDLDPRASVLRISTGHLSDPLKASSAQAEREWAIHQSFHPDATRIHHQVKTTLPLPIWAKYKIESTPHGRYSLLKGNVQAPVGKKLVEPSESYTSEFTTAKAFDHYTIDTDPATIARQFFKRGKRVEGYDGVSSKVNYNVVASTEPSMRAQYMHMRGASASTFPQHAVPLASSPTAASSASASTSASYFPQIRSPSAPASRFVESPAALEEEQ